MMKKLHQELKNKILLNKSKMLYNNQKLTMKEKLKNGKKKENNTIKLNQPQKKLKKSSKKPSKLVSYKRKLNSKLHSLKSQPTFKKPLNLISKRKDGPHYSKCQSPSPHLPTSKKMKTQLKQFQNSANKFQIKLLNQEKLKEKILNSPLLNITQEKMDSTNYSLNLTKKSLN